jgi:hypothetical protein
VVLPVGAIEYGSVDEREGAIATALRQLVGQQIRGALPLPSGNCVRGQLWPGREDGEPGCCAATPGATARIDTMNRATAGASEPAGMRIGGPATL